MRVCDLVLRLSDSRYYLAQERVVGPAVETWRFRPADCRKFTRDVYITMDITQCQILAKPKKQFLASACSTPEYAECFKDYDTLSQAVNDGPHDLKLRPGESYMVSETKIVKGFSGGSYWVLCNERWYVVTDTEDSIRQVSS